MYYLYIYTYKYICVYLYICFVLFVFSNIILVASTMWATIFGRFKAIEIFFLY